MVNVMKNMMEKAKETAMNAGELDGGAVSVSSGAFEGRTERSVREKSDSSVLRGSKATHHMQVTAMVQYS